MSNKPKVLLFDIETSPMLAYVWGLFDQNIGLNQIKEDWSVLAWAAKWLDDKPKNIMYMDTRNEKNVRNDLKMLKVIRDLLDEADVVITQNGRRFDSKKLNARFLMNKIKPPSPYKHIDTLVIAKRNFAFTSNKLEYMSETFNVRYKKMTTNRTFSGFALWSECLKGNIKAWKEMEVYNKYDVLALEELYKTLQPYDNTIQFSLYDDSDRPKCNCGSHRLQKNGFAVTASGRYQRYICLDCGKWHRDKTNLLSTDKKKKALITI